MKKLLVIPALLVGLVAAGCGTGNDVSKGSRDTGSAKAIVNMPNHFNNVAVKCYQGTGIYVTNNTGDAGTGTSLAVVTNDPICKN